MPQYGAVYLNVGVNEDIPGMMAELVAKDEVA